MDVRPIRTEADYDWALAEIERFFDEEPERGTAGADRFDVLAALIEVYEAQRWSIEAPDPVDLLKQAIADERFDRADLVRVIGSRSRTSEILNRKRPITMDMARRLNAELHVPAEALIRAYRLDR